MTLPQTVTFTGTLGAGQTATIVEDLGSVNGPRITQVDQSGNNAKIAEWSDKRRVRIAGIADQYDAILAASVGGFGYGSRHPWIGSIFGYDVSIYKASKEGAVVETAYKRPTAGSFTQDATFYPNTIGVGFTAMEIPAYTDNYGFLVVNSAGDPFVPPPTLTIFLTRIRILIWQFSYNLAVARTMIGKVNHAAVTLHLLGNIPARCLKILSWAPAQDINPDYSIVIPTIYELEYKGSFPDDGGPGGYDRNLSDKGYRAWYKDRSNVVRLGKLAQKANMQPIAEPELLDGNGQPLKPDPLMVVDPKNGFQAFNPYPGAADPQLPLLGGDAEGYLTPVAAPGGGVYLPYRIELESDFAPLVATGI